MRWTILVADDDRGTRAAVAGVVAEEPDLELVGEAETAIEAVEGCARLTPDIALVDVAMPGGGPAAARGIATRSPRTRVIAYSGFEDPGTVREMLKAGAVAYAIKGGTRDELLESIRAAGLREPRAPQAAPAKRERNGRPTTVLAADPDATVLESLAEGLDRLAGAELVGLAQGASHALSLAGRLAPDVALVGGDGEDWARTSAALRAASPRTRVLTLRVFRDPWWRARIDAPERLQVRADALSELERVLTTCNGEVTTVSLPLVAGPDTGDRDEAVRGLLDDPVPMALQPIVTLSGTDRVVGHEALARFSDGAPPDRVFADAHRAGLGVALELHAAGSAAAAFGRTEPGAFLSVNVSPETAMHPGLVERLDGVPPEHVVLELTEHAPVRDYAALGTRLDALRRRGYRVAVDDCGAGFASLRHVVLVGPDFLKLDVLLCRQVRTPMRWAMAKALAGFAEETGVVAIAEGVEDEGDREALAELGVPLAQGHLLGEPVGPLAA